MKKLTLIGGFVLALVLPAVAKAQFIPTGGAIAFAPQISVVESGALLDAQATVSADRRYVTITERPQLSTLLNLQSFAFETQTAVTPGTQPGSMGGKTPMAAHAVGPANRPVVNAPVFLGAGAGAALSQPGMTPIRSRS